MVQTESNTNLWHQRTPHRSCQLILVRYSADTNEWRCAFVQILRVRIENKMLLDFNHRIKHAQIKRIYIFPFG